MADRVLSELAGQRGCLILVTGDRREPASRELTSPDALAQFTRLLTNLPGDVPAVLATVHDVSSGQSGGHPCHSRSRRKGARRETIPPTGRAVPGSVSRERGTVTGPGSRGSQANHLDQTTAAYPTGHKTAKTVSASDADAESG
jgi:hypothetical protein